MATRIIAVLNQKGGVGKTTTCANLSAGLALRGKRVLLVDMDPQANLTVHMGLEPQHAKRSSYSLLLGEHGLAEAIQDTATPGLRLLPSTLALANAEIQLAAAVGRELILREAIESWLDPEPEIGLLPSAETAEPGAADFIVIDCPPSLGILTMNALCAATDVLLPIQTEFFALQGVAGLLESLRAVQRLNRRLRLSMVLPCMVDFRTNLARDVVEEVRKHFGPLVAKTLIHQNIKLAEAPSHGKTIFEYDAESRGAVDYRNLAAEILGDEVPEAGPPEPRRRATKPKGKSDERDEKYRWRRNPPPTAEGDAPRAEAPAEQPPAPIEAPPPQIDPRGQVPEADEPGGPGEAQPPRGSIGYPPGASYAPEAASAGRVETQVAADPARETAERPPLTDAPEPAAPRVDYGAASPAPEEAIVAENRVATPADTGAQRVLPAGPATDAPRAENRLPADEQLVTDERLTTEDRFALEPAESESAPAIGEQTAEQTAEGAAPDLSATSDLPVLDAEALLEDEYVDDAVVWEPPQWALPPASRDNADRGIADMGVREDESGRVRLSFEPDPASSTTEIPPPTSGM